MSYKYPALKSISNWIREGKIPEGIDIAEIYRFWIKHHPHKIKKYPPWKNKPRFYNRALSCNARAKNNGDNNKITSDDLELIYKRDSGKCKYCGAKDNIVFDHVVSYYRGGTNTVDNMQLLCRTCNMEKGVS